MISLAELWAFDKLIKKLAEQIRLQELSGKKLNKVEGKVKQIVELWGEVKENDS